MDLKEVRTNAGYTQEQLATLCGVTHSYIGMMEAGKRSPSVKLAKRLADVLNINWHDFF